jgi:hypothetical protein
MKDGVIADFEITENDAARIHPQIVRRKNIISPAAHRDRGVPYGHHRKWRKRAVRDRPSTPARVRCSSSPSPLPRYRRGPPVDKPSGNMIIDIAAAQPRNCRDPRSTASCADSSIRRRPATSSIEAIVQLRQAHLQHADRRTDRRADQDAHRV